jgi:hypothetical protein
MWAIKHTKKQRSLESKRLRTQWAMTRSEEEDSVAKETQQVEFIKPMRDLLLLVLLFPLHLKILHKRLLIKYNKLFSFHFKFVAYLKFPDLCTRHPQSLGRFLQLIIDIEIHSRNKKRRLDIFPDLRLCFVFFFCVRITPLEMVISKKTKPVDEG